MSFFIDEKLKYLSLLLIFSISLNAGTSGKIVGKVTDENGNVLIGCNVFVRGTSLGAATNQNGEYFILNIPPGYYQVSASMIGYGSVTIKDLQVIVDLTAKANFTLTTEFIEGEEVVVIAETPTVRLDQTSMTAVIGADDIENLPVSELSDLIELQAGVVKDESGGFHVRGGRSGEVSFWVDGISTTDAYDNSSGLEIENSGVQEIQVISGTFNAEYGQAMSGIVNVVTKDGGEKFEGSLNLYSGGFHSDHNDLYSLSSPFANWKSFDDKNNNGVWDYGEILYDLNNNGVYDEGESYWDKNGNNQWDGNDYMEDINSDVGNDGYLGDYYDSNGDGNYTQPSIGEGNGRKDWGEHSFDLNDNGYIDRLNFLKNPLQQINLAASLSGPIPLLPPNFTFYSNLRIFKTNNRYYGMNLFLPNGSFGDEEIVPLAPFEKLAGQLKLTWKKSAQTKLSLTSFLTEKTYRNFDSYFKYNPDGINWNYEKDYSYIFDITRSISSKTFYEIKYLNFSTQYSQKLFADIQDIPFQQQIISTQELDSYNLSDSISFRSGYDITTKIPRYEVTWINEDLVSIVDRKDQNGYIASDQFQTPAWSFGRGGTQNGRFERETRFQQIKFDISSQINTNHFVKAGFLVKMYNMEVDDKFIVPKNNGSWSVTSSGDTIGFSSLNGSRVYPFEPTINPTYTTNHNYLKVKPKEIAFYLQDKIEFDEIIINAGLRFDYFDPNWKIPKDSRMPENRKYYLANSQNDTIVFWEHDIDQIAENINIIDSLNLQGAINLENLFSAQNSNNTLSEIFNSQLDSIRKEYRWDYGYKKANTSFQLSPRIGIAYPITDRGVIHISYGHFFQIPQFSFLYNNPEFEITNSNNGGILGNANLRPEKTIMYEVGVKQEIARLTSIDVTLFYRDTRDWVGISPTIKKYPVGNYRKYQNMDYANTRGFTIMFERRYKNNFGLNIDYSWMLAEGTYSNPTDAYFDALNDQSPRLAMVPLNWDQTHTLNLRLTFGGEDWITSIIGNYWSGKPYTPEFKTGSVSGSSAFAGFAENSSRKPNIISFDMRTSYELKLLGFKSNLFINVYNIFDIRNEINVWNDTGRATYTLSANDVSLTNPERIGNLNEHLLKPEWYSEPRKIDIGLKISF